MGNHLPFAELLTLYSLTIATVSQNGQPHAAAVYFVNDNQLNFYFISKPDSQHCLDLAANLLAAISISSPLSNWQNINGLQMRGKITEIVSIQQKLKAETLYQEKFPFVKTLQNEVAKNRWYVFSPEWLRWIDNRIHFGHKQEWFGNELIQLYE